jgi:hypothetical protein
MLNLKTSKLLILFSHLKRRIPPPNSKAEDIKLKGGVMLATKCDLAEISNEDICYALICKRALFLLDDIARSLPPAVTNILHEYEDVFPTEIPLELQPMRGIEHQIDLIPGATLPNRATYRTNPSRLRKFSDKSKAFWTVGMYVRVLVLVLFLCFWFLRKMVLGVYVLIAEPSIILLFDIVILFLG